MDKNREYNSLSDAELVAYLRNGDDNAFTELYNRYKGILHIHAYKKLGDFEEAKDVLQDMFSWIWNNRESIPHTQNVAGYLYTITRNKILNVIAHKKIVSKYTASFDNFMEQGVFITDLAVREKELADMIEREINALPIKTREVFILSRQLNLSYKEISDQLDITENTVKYHIKGALKALRVKLGLMAYLLFLLRF
ncbi:RNA polymerase sigma factor [Pedobacter sp. MC2016-24]|uniref:RNA polymerase sigma factor n=1 Tax=Pedobacter sp. MC2016-24 TaxID=2780090 RepID=UPI00187E901F|nr:RNA polymerase sigma-70 factor [Pedobacter sp. MC2016-24]MBE9600176.1 RNA polymerase sigma-70 factor [Pedobacter sp. MC2016-24]